MEGTPLPEKAWTRFVRVEDNPRIPGEIWLNSRYQVVKSLVGDGDMGPLIHLSIKRRDRASMHDWRELQRIKNELVGPDAEGVELYPAESRLVDTSNQYHLWVFPKFKFPFGYGDRMVALESAAGAQQRPFEDPPSDAKRRDELEALHQDFLRGGK